MPADITSSVLQGIEDCHNKIIVTEKNVTTGQNFDVIDESAEETVGSKRKHSESNNDELNSKTTENIKHLKRPLANILPSKYKNVDCSTLFPDFQVGQVLRFSRLFKPNKTNRSPNTWNNVNNKHKQNKPNDANNCNPSDDNRIQFPDLEFGPLPGPEHSACDDVETFLQPIENISKQTDQSSQQNKNCSNNPSYWRNGPAKYWYDMLGVPENGEGFDYGFKLKDKKIEVDGNRTEKNSFPDEAFLMVNQLNWEDNIIWNGEDIKHEVLQKLNSKTNDSGWVLNSTNCNTWTINQPGNKIQSIEGGMVKLATSNVKVSQFQNKIDSKLKVNPKNQPINNTTDNTWYSIFPVENEELVYGSWEDEIIWDAKNMEKIPCPKILTLDLNDENIILGVPDDVDPAKLRLDGAVPLKPKTSQLRVKKSKSILEKAGVINIFEEHTSSPPPKPLNLDPLNVSNDCYYQSQSSETFFQVGSGKIMQHSIPVVKLSTPFIPSHIGPTGLKNFHRPLMKRYSHGAISQSVFHPIQPLLKNIIKIKMARDEERIASGGGHVFFMRTPDDLTGRDGSIILIEYCEEHPPLLSQVGMCSKIKNYYKRKIGKDIGPPTLRFGEVAYAHTSPFLGGLKQGETIQAIENNLYRSPIYEHKPLKTDFLLLRTRHAYYIREIDAVFTSGQLCPLYEVPSPNSKRVGDFLKNFFQVFIYRLFWKSDDCPKRIKIDDIKKAFPKYAEHNLRKHLQLCADFKRSTAGSCWWVIKPDFHLPSEEEICAMVSPEQCCAYFSMLAAQQRLQDAGYVGKCTLTSLEDNDNGIQSKIDDEMKVAPWNTTQAFVRAMQNKCLLQLTGPADPTGCGEGFSYVKVSNKPAFFKTEQEPQPKRSIRGTDSDLRRLSMKDGKALLKKFNVPDEEINKLSRWEMIDVVRTLSTEKAKVGANGITKFSRRNRFSIAEHQERYKEECQRLFDLQNQVLSSYELLTTDEGESSDDEDSSDIEEMGKNIENILSNKKTNLQLSLEKEEQERVELYKMISEKQNNLLEKKDQKTININDGCVLKIYRTFQDADGNKFTRTEIVRNSSVIEAYVKIKTNANKDALTDEAKKKHIKCKRQQTHYQNQKCKKSSNTRLQSGFSFSLTNKKNSSNNKILVPAPETEKITKPEPKVRCGACGNLGHKRTNKDCPLYNLNSNESFNVALTEEQEQDIEKQINVENNNLVNVDGTKITLSSKLLKHVDEVKRKSLVLKIPKDTLTRKKHKRDHDCDYLKLPGRSANRRCTNPLIDLTTIFESILNEMRRMPNVHPFIYPVNVKKLPDYYNIVIRPMDLQTIRNKLHLKQYQNREDFLFDVNQIVKNSSIYNGVKSPYTDAARCMLDVCVDSLHKKEKRIMLLEKAINPLIDNKDQAALSLILNNVVGKVKTMSEALPFMKPVNPKLVKDYNNIIKQPIDLETIALRVLGHKYHSRKEFLADINLILENSIVYNGGDSDYTQQARRLLKMALKSLKKFDQYLTEIEQKIDKAQTHERIKININAATNDNYSDLQENIKYSRKHNVNSKIDPNNRSCKTQPNCDIEDDLSCLSQEDNFVEVTENNPSNNNSHQIAKAMILIRNIEYNSTPETMCNQVQANPSMDHESSTSSSNLLPIDNFITNSSSHQNLTYLSILDDLEISDSDEETANKSAQINSLDKKTENETVGELWF